MLVELKQTYWQFLIVLYSKIIYRQYMKRNTSYGDWRLFWPMEQFSEVYNVNL